MKAGKGICTWHSCLSVAVVGAMALAVSVQASPRAGERDKSGGKSGSTRLVTGPSAHINDAIAGGATAVITIQPVAPKTFPASATNGSIAAQTQTLATTPARVWIELQATGWAPDILKTCQITISGDDVADMDGGGYMGSNSGCGGDGGNISPARQACGGTCSTDGRPCIANGECRFCTGGTNAGNVCTATGDCPGGTCPAPAGISCVDPHDICRTNMSGLDPVPVNACALGEPARCVRWDGVSSPGNYFPAGLFCEPGYQDKCDSEWIGTGIAFTPAVDISSINYRYGGAADPGAEPPDFAPSYVGTLVLDVPANAKGTYQIDSDETQTFLQNPENPPDNDIPVAAINSAFIVVGCGSCCFGVGGAAPGCVDAVSASQCAALAPVAIYNLGGTCVNPPTDDGCCACLANADCNDGDACTTDICNSCVCSNPPKASWDQGTECCDSATGVETTLGCADQCEAASCSLPGNHGSAGCNPRTGQSCDDENPCTYADTCAGGAGSCAGSDANAVACVDSADCAAATGVGYPCIDGFCNCTLTPDLDIEIIDLGGPNCFEDGEKVTANIVIGASSSPVNGGQFLIGWDTSCLDFVSIAGVAPYTNTVYGPVVNETAGTVFIAVGVEFGAGNGDNGGTIATMSFIKRGSCNSCQICPLNNNPMNTYLTDNEGQRITVAANCSKAIYDESDMVLTTPGNIKTNVDCGDSPTAVESWPAPSATDECGNAQVFCRGEHESGLQYDSATVNGGGEFPIGASSFCCYAVSDGPCGTTVGCPPDTTCVDADSNGKPDGCWTVTVNDETSLDITVGLAPSSQSKPGDNLTRCIKFTLFSNCVQEPLVFSDNVTFGGLFEFVGKSTGKIKIPGSGQWDCITAQDQLHTLRSCYTFGPNDCAGGQLNAAFSGDPRLGGNWLIGGNLDGWKKDDPNSNPSLDTIDILDFGTFVMQYLAQYGDTDTPCGTAGPNADINGDGMVDLEDYAFVSSNFLVNSKQCCCGPQTASAIAITEISVAQLRADGNGDLAAGDLNGDGLLNLADMAAFDQGVRPTKKTQGKGGSRTGSR